uniref:Glycosyltransferase n=1 Tax=Scoparia dulcis TaxID=107240 RepID=A0A5H2QAA5_SCODU|nr:UDP-glycosyltransferase [Scoparia dulcis]
MAIDMKPHAVVIPFPTQGHIRPLLKLAKILHFKGFYITFVNTEFNHKRLIRSQGPDSVKGLEDFQLKTIRDGLPPSDKDATQDMFQLCESLLRNGLPQFSELVESLNRSSDCPNVTCIVSDGDLTSFTLDVAEKLNIPEVLFFTNSACGFNTYCNYNGLAERGLFPLKDESQITNGYLETRLDWVPGMRNIRLRDFPTFIRTTDPHDLLIEFDLLQIANASRASAVVINTFDELDKEVLGALRQKFDKVCTLGPIHMLEQLVEDHNVKSIGSSLWKEDDTCIAWLNQMPPNSVLYINFGSVTVLSPHQLLELALGLANSHHYFLWIIRPDLVSGESAILPEEYLKEVDGRAKIVGWCSQEQVLSHPSLGGFLSHCGWNSTVESISNGVPMICWPFTAEQPTNCRYACTDWGMGLEIEGEITREKVTHLVKVLMEREKGKEMTKKALEWKDKARLAVKPGGSSHNNLEFLIKEVLLKNF